MPKLPAGIYKTEYPLSQPAKISWATAQYEFTAYKSRTVPSVLRQLSVLSSEIASLAAEVAAIHWTRDLINLPTSDLGPTELADYVHQLAKKHRAKVQEWIGEALLKAGFPAVHAVGRAGSSPPRMLVLRWGNPEHPHVSLVGKGVCFDSGGLDIKPSGGMRWMKKDMGGAAHVLGLAHWLMTLAVPIYLQVYIPAVENSISAAAYRPGDVLTMRNGLTVEIDNTDAEGRLILADALVKACEDRPDLIIQFATLTGAARVAVGTEIAAFFTPDEGLAKAVQAVSLTVDDPVWRLPLHAPYDHLFRSYIADMANSSSSAYAGAIIAALFLEKFITTNIPWIHFDMMAWNVSTKPGKPEGGEAMGLRTMGHYLCQRFSAC
jgi:leucyl aminopeptidase